MGRLALLAAGLAFATTAQSWSPPPDRITGTSRLWGDPTPNATVEIRRTEYGVPHIQGETLEAAAYGFGYCQAEDHLPNILHGMIGARGQLAETFGADAVRAAHAAGQLDFGENRVQEALAKRADITDLPIRWHLIGPLQSNKANKVPGAFASVQSVHSVELLERLARAAVAKGVQLPVLVQVDLAHEATKSGLDEAELRPPGICPLKQHRSGVRLRRLVDLELVAGAFVRKERRGACERQAVRRLGRCVQPEPLRQRRCSRCRPPPGAVESKQDLLFQNIGEPTRTRRIEQP